MFLSLLRRYEGWFSFAFVLALIVAGFTAFQAFFGYAAPSATPVPVAQANQPTLVIANPTGTPTTIPSATATPTVPPTMTPTLLPPATATVPPTVVLPATPTDTAVPTPLPTTPPLPTDTPVPPANQPPQVQAELLPIDIDDDREAGVFQIQVAASDPENALQTVLIILKLPASTHERKIKQKKGEKTEIKFTNKQLEIKAPDPQALVDQINAYGGILVQNEQQIDLRRKGKGEGKFTWRDDEWRIEAEAIDLTVIATDGVGASRTISVQSCLSKDCPAEEHKE